VAREEPAPAREYWRRSVVTVAVGLATSLVAVIAAVLIAAALGRPRGVSAGELLRLFPDLVRLLASLSKDRRVSRTVRWRLLVALAYNAQPINLIPDFVPVIGLVDNIMVAAWAVRSAIRKSGPAIVLSNWSGTPAGFALLCRLCRLNAADEETETPEPDIMSAADGREIKAVAQRHAAGAGPYGVCQAVEGTPHILARCTRPGDSPPGRHIPADGGP
jgi:uncharacterized membrane protein YkvA (DUF1232 family)